MNISFAVTDIATSEGEGLVTLLLEKTVGAIGPVSVRIFTIAGTALGMSKLISRTPIIIIVMMISPQTDD